MTKSAKRAARPPVYRPKRYLKRQGPRSRRYAPWLLALRRLWERQRWSDGQIAEALCDLSAEQIERIEREKTWHQVKDGIGLSPGSGIPFSRRQVRYHRQSLGLAGRKQRSMLDSLRRGAANERAYRLGWGGRGYLTPAELRLLEELATSGPGTRHQLEVRTGLQLDASRLGGRTPLRRLQEKRLVCVARLRPVPVYWLSPGVQRRAMRLEEALDSLPGLLAAFEEPDTAVG